MHVTLNSWKPKGATKTLRVYVNGLPISSKAWFQNSRGTALLVFQEPGDGDFRQQTLVSVGAQLGIEVEGWDDFLEAIEAAPAPAPAPVAKSRGRGPGQMAANRRNGATGNGERWTADDAATLDLNFKTYPFEVPTRMVVDDREPALMVDMLRSITNLEVDVATLDVGDYAVPGKVVIERKTVTDFISSITLEDKRLFFQAERMALLDVPAVLIVEGDLYGQQRMTLPQLAGALSYRAACHDITGSESAGHAIRHASQFEASPVTPDRADRNGGGGQPAADADLQTVNGSSRLKQLRAALNGVRQAHQ